MPKPDRPRFTVRLRWQHPTYSIYSRFSVVASDTCKAIARALRDAKQDPRLAEHLGGQLSAAVWRRR